MWVNNKKTGPGVLKLENGIEKKGEWKDDEFVKEYPDMMP